MAVDTPESPAAAARRLSPCDWPHANYGNCQCFGCTRADAITTFLTTLLTASDEALRRESEKADAAVRASMKSHLRAEKAEASLATTQAEGLSQIDQDILFSLRGRLAWWTTNRAGSPLPFPLNVTIDCLLRIVPTLRALTPPPGLGTAETDDRGARPRSSAGRRDVAGA